MIGQKNQTIYDPYPRESPWSTFCFNAACFNAAISSTVCQYYFFRLSHFNIFICLHLYYRNCLILIFYNLSSLWIHNVINILWIIMQKHQRKITAQ